MDSRPEIKIRIRPDGEVEIDVAGVQGGQCTDLTRFLEETLGPIVERELKPEYWNTNAQSISLPQPLKNTRSS